VRVCARARACVCARACSCLHACALLCVYFHGARTIPMPAFMHIYSVCVLLLPCMQVGDGTTSVVILAGEFLKEAKAFIEEGAHPRVSNVRPLGSSMQLCNHLLEHALLLMCCLHCSLTAEYHQGFPGRVSACNCQS